MCAPPQAPPAPDTVCAPELCPRGGGGRGWTHSGMFVRVCVCTSLMIEAALSSSLSVCFSLSVCLSLSLYLSPLSLSFYLSLSLPPPSLSLTSVCLSPLSAVRHCFPRPTPHRTPLHTVTPSEIWEPHPKHCSFVVGSLLLLLLVSLALSIWN